MQTELPALGNAIRHFRKRAGYTQTQACAATEYSQCWLSRVERGEEAPSLKLLFALTELYQISLHQLFAHAGI